MSKDFILAQFRRQSFSHKCITLTLNCRLNFNVVRKLLAAICEAFRELRCSLKWPDTFDTHSHTTELINYFCTSFRLGLLYPLKSFPSFIKLVFFIYIRLIFHKSTFDVQCKSFSHEQPNETRDTSVREAKHCFD